DLDLLAVLRAVVVADLVEQRFLRLVDVLDEVDDAARVAELDLLLLVIRALVGEADLEALVEERHHLEALEDRARGELHRLEDRTVGPERHGGARTAAGRVADDLELALRHATVLELHAMALAVAVDLDHETARQRVHDRDADAVQLGEGDLDAGQLVLLVDVDGDAATVVDDLAPAVGEERDVDAGREARHGLVDGVVDDFPHTVVQPGRTGAADVHAGPLADRLEAFEDLHVPGPVGATRLRQNAPFEGWASEVLPYGLTWGFVGRSTGSR